MKKACMLVLLVLFSALLFGETLESSYSYVTYNIFKILQSSEGYVIMYPKADATMGQIYVPIEWFKPGDKKAFLQDKVKQLPSVLTVFYKNGEFSHVKIVVPTNRSLPIWSVLPNPEAYSSKFNLETLTIE